MTRYLSIGTFCTGEVEGRVDGKGATHGRESLGNWESARIATMVPKRGLRRQRCWPDGSRMKTTLSGRGNGGMGALMSVSVCERGGGGFTANAARTRGASWWRRKEACGYDNKQAVEK